MTPEPLLPREGVLPKGVAAGKEDGKLLEIPVVYGGKETRTDTRRHTLGVPCIGDEEVDPVFLVKSL